MSLGTDGVCRELQLSGKLQEIIAKHRAHFNGAPAHVSAADVETETDNE